MSGSARPVAWGAVALGGALGTLLRAGGMLVFPPELGAIPWVILVENVTGAFFLGALTGWLLAREPLPPWLEDFLVPGMLGSFTTFSALAVDVIGLGAGRGAGYLALSVATGLAAAAAGLALGSTRASALAAPSASPPGDPRR